MSDYGRFQERGGAPASAQVKRPRAEFDNVPLAGSNYVSREETRYDARDGRFPWMEPTPLGVGFDANRSMIPYPSGGVTSANAPGLSSAPYMGSGPLGDPKLGVSSFNDPMMTAPSGRVMAGLDLSLQRGSNIVNGGRLDHIPKQDLQSRGLAGHGGVAPQDVTNTLYVEGLPADCTRREAAHIFRPFLGYKEVRVVRKEGKRAGDQFAICFVDFEDPKSASIALEALQGYKFDETDRDTHTLRLQYSRYPGTRPAPRDGGRGPRDRDGVPPNRPFLR